MKLKERLQQLRQADGLTQPELAEAVGLTRSVIANIESRTVPSIKVLQALCDFYGLTPEQLFKGVDSFSPEKESAEDKVKKLEDKVNELEKLLKGKR